MDSPKIEINLLPRNTGCIESLSVCGYTGIVFNTTFGIRSPVLELIKLGVEIKIFGVDSSKMQSSNQL